MYETADDISRLQAVIDESACQARPALSRNFGDGGWRMVASEFVAFWGEMRMASVATSALSGVVHAAPLEVRLVRGVFKVPTFSDAVRLRDHRENSRRAITAWDDAYHAVIVSGDAHVPAAGAGTLAVTVTPTRIFGIRPPRERNNNVVA